MERSVVPATDVPRRVTSLPLPTSLTASVGENKKRIKLIEKIIKAHRTKACLEESEFAELTAELQELKAVLQPSATTITKASESGDGQAGFGADSKLRVKRDIRDIEKQLKQQKKTPFLSVKEVSELAERLERLKEELNKLDDWNPVVLTLALGDTKSDIQGQTVDIAATDRISIVGLHEDQAISLLGLLEGAVGAEVGPTLWKVWRHDGLKAAVLRCRDTDGLADELRVIAASSPHVIALGTSSLRARGGVCAILRAFQGALILIEDDDARDPEAIDTACLLHAMGVTSRWGLRDGVSSGLERLDIPKALQGDVVGDLRLRDVKDSPDLAAVFDEADALCLAEFDEHLAEVLSVDVVRLGLLVSMEVQAAKSPKETPKFLGFITYKFWGPPLKAMSISRVAVPKKYQMQGFGRQLVRWAVEKAKGKSRFECDRVTLSAIPKAITFYERLNFVPVQDDIPEDGPSKDGAVRMEFNLGRATKR